MNELTLHGNIADNPILRHSTNGTPVLNLTVAVNESRLDRETGEWKDLPPVYHRVVAFNTLALNVTDSEGLALGALVTVTGKFADDSWETEDGTRRHQTKLLASDIALSLRYATVAVTRNPKKSRPDQVNGRDAEEPSVPGAGKRAPAKRATAKRLAVVGSGG
jgi:single-strand DNA-binding protein